ncbi:hypothetical protein [Streptomyces sp. NPDC005970]
MSSPRHVGEVLLAKPDRNEPADLGELLVEAHHLLARVMISPA